MRILGFLVNCRLPDIHPRFSLAGFAARILKAITIMAESDPSGRAVSYGRQLSLFKGKRQRGIAPPPAREFALHCMVADVLKRFLMPQWRYTHLPMGELRDSVTASRLKRMGVTRGWPDLMFISATGEVCFMELKRRGNHLTEDQDAIATFLINADLRYNCVDNFQDAITVLKVWGVVRSGIDVQ